MLFYLAAKKTLERMASGRVACRFSRPFLKPKKTREKSPNHVDLTFYGRFWGCHFTGITTSNSAPDLCNRLQSFLSQKCLYWLEVLSLIQSVNIAHSCLSDVMAWTKVNILLVILCELLRDISYIGSWPNTGRLHCRPAEIHLDVWWNNI